MAFLKLNSELSYRHHGCMDRQVLPETIHLLNSTETICGTTPNLWLVTKTSMRWTTATQNETLVAEFIAGQAKLWFWAPQPILLGEGTERG